MQFFATADDMAEGETVFDAMDRSEAPGTRASVDRGEIKFELACEGHDDRFIEAFPWPSGRNRRSRRADETIGGAPTFTRIAARFYELVAGDEILRPLYPEGISGRRRSACACSVIQPVAVPPRTRRCVTLAWNLTTHASPAEPPHRPSRA